MVDPLLSDSDIDQLRADAAASMHTQCVVEEWIGRAPQGADGVEEDLWEVLFASVCEVAGPAGSPQGSVRMVDVGGVQRPLIEGGIVLPVTGHALDPGKRIRIRITGLGPRDDPATLQKKYLVKALPGKSNAVKRRVDVVEV